GATHVGAGRHRFHRHCLGVLERSGVGHAVEQRGDIGRPDPDVGVGLDGDAVEPEIRHHLQVGFLGVARAVAEDQQRVVGEVAFGLVDVAVLQELPAFHLELHQHAQQCRSVRRRLCRSPLRPGDEACARGDGESPSCDHHRFPQKWRHLNTSTASAGGQAMIGTRKTPAELRSARWFAPDDLRAFGHRSRAMQMGYAPEDWVAKPVIAIVNTWSDAQPCHMHFKSRVDDVRRGILQAGGFPMELPALSLSESLLKPTTMLYRNLLAMDAEELLRGHPVDGVVLMGGCDKTTPALLLGAISAGLPAIYLPAGPMLRGNWKGKVLGSGSDAWKYWDERRAGTITDSDWVDVEAGIARSYGTCMTMGTAATMMAIAETLGMTLPGASSIPAADANHIRMASESGRRIVDMVWEDLTPKEVLGRNAFLNAITVAM